jgi:DNA invertase Pin-like site-specific DNA recombinase
MGAINEYERDMIVARMKAGRITKAKKGQHATGRIPMGYTSEVVNGRRTLVKNDSEAEVVRLCFKLRYKGLSFRKIAAYLNNGGDTRQRTAQLNSRPTFTTALFVRF